MPRFGRFLHFLSRRSLAVASRPSTRLLFPPPGLRFNEVLLLRSLYLRRSSFCYLLLLRACSTRLNHSPGFFAANVQCFALVGKLTTIGRARDNTSSPALALSSIPFPPPLHQTSLVLVASCYPCKPRTPRKASSVFAPSF